MQQIGVRAAGFEPCHQPVVVDPVKEALQVQVHHPAVAAPDVRLDMAHGLMGRALRAKAVAVSMEVGFPLRGNHLRNGLLDEPIQHRGDAQGAHLAVWFGDLHATHRLRAVAARDQSGADVWPVVSEMLGKHIDGHAVNARRAFVLAYLFQCALQVGAF